MVSEGVTSMETLLQQGSQLFSSEFQKNPEIAGCAPGRVNLIGEHTDYNEGFVLPMALPLVTLVIGSKNNKSVCRIVTASQEADEPHKLEFAVPTTTSPLKPGLPKWANYMKGVISHFEDTIVGFDAVIVTNVPVGSGVSSSASLEVATYSFLEGVTGHQTTDLRKKALLCQKAEHEFASMPCGIMDQFISVLGIDENALLIDCRSLEFEYVPIKAKEYLFLITDSNVHHQLSGSEYPVRRSMCYSVAEQLNKKSLRDASLSEIQSLLQNQKINETMFKRARHVITEIDRTVKAVEALKKEDYNAFGKLMNSSHHSLRTDYEVSCKELDELVSISQNVSGVLGSRMTGGGFGGCTVTLVKKSVVDELISRIKENYAGEPKFFIGVPSAGARTLKLPE